MTSRTANILGFALMAVLVLALDRAGRRPGSRLAGFRQVLGRMMVTRRGRIGVLLVWWWLGWHFLAR